MRTVFGLLFLAASPVLAQPARPPVAPLARFLARAERVIDSLGTRAQRATWVQENFITDDTEILNAQASRDLAVAVQQLAMEARQFDGRPMTSEQRRKLVLLKLLLSAPPPADGAKATELSQLGAALDADYGKGTYCRPSRADPAKPQCRQLQELSTVLAASRDPASILCPCNAIVHLQRNT